MVAPRVEDVSPLGAGDVFESVERRERRAGLAEPVAPPLQPLAHVVRQLAAEIFGCVRNTNTFSMALLNQQLNSSNPYRPVSAVRGQWYIKIPTSKYFGSK